MKLWCSSGVSVLPCLYADVGAGALSDCRSDRGAPGP